MVDRRFDFDLHSPKTRVAGAPSGLGRAVALKRAHDDFHVVAEVVTFLTSPRASCVIGAVMAAEGGRIAI